MPAPVIVALNADFAALVTAHLQGQGHDITTDQVQAALDAAARYEDATPQPDLFA